MIADIIVSFCIFSLLSMTEFSAKIWSMILMGWNKVLDPALCGVSVPCLAPDIYVSSLTFMTHLSSYDNIFETKTWTWYFWGKWRSFLGHLYTCWTSEGMDITQEMTKW